MKRRKECLPHYEHAGMIDLPAMTPNNGPMIPSDVQQALPRRLACSRCGASFECGSGGAGGTCWCADEAYRLPMPADATEDCLCSACLRAAAAAAGLSA